MNAFADGYTLRGVVTTPAPASPEPSFSPLLLPLLFPFFFSFEVLRLPPLVWLTVRGLLAPPLRGADALLEFSPFREAPAETTPRCRGLPFLVPPFLGESDRPRFPWWSLLKTTAL